MRKHPYILPVVLLLLGAVFYPFGLIRRNLPAIILGGIFLGIGADVLICRMMRARNQKEPSLWMWFILLGCPVLLAGLPFWFMDVVGAGLIICGMLVYIFAVHTKHPGKSADLRPGVPNTKPSAKKNPFHDLWKTSQGRAKLIITCSMAAIAGILLIGSIVTWQSRPSIPLVQSIPISVASLQHGYSEPIQSASASSGP